jgi:hypothetical protein
MFDFLKGKEQLKNEAVIKAKRAKLTKRVQSTYEREYEKQYETQAMEKVRKKAEEDARRKLNPVPWTQKLSAIGSAIGNVDKQAGSFLSGNPAQNTMQAHKNAVKGTAKAHAQAHKSVDDMIRDLPQ